MKTNWKELDRDLIKLTGTPTYGTRKAQKAIEEILGDEWIEQAVKEAILVEDRKASELAMNCLRLIYSEKAANYAYHIYRTFDDKQVKADAVWLIKHIRHENSFDWVEEFLNDPDVIIWGLGLLDQLLWDDIIDFEENFIKIEYLLNLSLQNSKGQTKENVDFIKGYLKKRTQ